MLILIQQLDKNLNWKWNQLPEDRTDMDVSLASGENILSKVEYESDYIMKEPFSLILNFVWLFCAMILEKFELNGKHHWSSFGLLMILQQQNIFLNKCLKFGL